MYIYIVNIYIYTLYIEREKQRDQFENTYIDTVNF